MTVTPGPHPAADDREPRRARRAARAFEAFMGAQALSLHRTVSVAGRAVLGPGLTVARRPVPGTGPAC